MSIRFTIQLPSRLRPRFPYQGVPPLAGYQTRADASEPAPEFDLPLHDPPREPVAPVVVRDAPSSSGLAMAAGMLVIGLLAGFVAGFVVAQRLTPPPPPRVVDVPRPAPAPPAFAPAVPSTEPTVGTSAVASPTVVEEPAAPAPGERPVR
ncbi:MAG: hypothetical protein HY824_17135 [Acidobacteria bacterium]|nr:hypothetical protein [Acidobacteriota bacterium]